MQSRSRSRSSSQSSYRDQKGQGNFIEPSQRLFVTGISPEVVPFFMQISQEDIRSMFEKVGTVCDLYLKRMEGKDNFAFVGMGSLEEAAQAINALNGKRLGEKMIMVKYAKPKPNRTEGKDNFNRGPRDREQKGDRKPFFGNQPGNQEERPNRFKNNEMKGGFDNKRQGFGRRDQEEGGQSNFERQGGNDFPRRQGGDGKGFDRTNFGRGGKTEVAAKPPMTSSSDFDY